LTFPGPKTERDEQQTILTGRKPTMSGYFKPLQVGIVLATCLAGCNTNPMPAPGQTGCAADDPRVGMTAVIEGISHGVSGTARIVGNCTIVIEHFYYDGVGVDPRVVGSKANGSEMVILSDNLVRLGGYEDETLIVTLPEGITLDEVERIGISCVPFGLQFNFGDGTFQ